MKKLCYLFFLISIVSCQEEIDLTGHWHLKRIDNREHSIVDEFPTIDIQGDSFAILGNHIGGYWGLVGGHMKKEKRLFFGGECLYLQFRYELKNGELILVEEDYEAENIIDIGTYIASRCGKNCCDKQLDYFFYEKVDIDLPITSKEKECIELRKRILERRIYLGIPKEEFQKEYGTDYRLFSRYKFLDINDLDLWEAKHKIKVPESKHSQIYQVIYADRNTLMSKLKPLFQYFKNKKAKNVSLALRKKDYTNGLVVCLRAIDFEQIDLKKIKAQTLEEWLTEN